MDTKVEVISALVIGATGLITAICLGIRKLRIKRCKSVCFDVELNEMTRSNSSDLPHDPMNAKPILALSGDTSKK